ncbi:hypothetical protein BZA77DRAFT_301966 [Pyronema omphalodes]|nr:hypothetical protein BZA77DRAFT_301966 [Pyronema omphalodes]
MILPHLATELLLQIISYLSPSTPFSSPEDYDGPPPLKSLSQTSRQFYSLCFPYLYSHLRLRLSPETTSQQLISLSKFLSHNQLRASNLSLHLAPRWNYKSQGLDVKKFLWSQQVQTLSIHATRIIGNDGVGLREKCAKWPYQLQSLQELRLVTIDGDHDIKMLLLRSCPISSLVIDDGFFEGIASRDLPSMGLLGTKPGMFPCLRKLTYSGNWVPPDRVMELLSWIKQLPSLRELEFGLVSGEKDLRLKRKEIWFQPSEKGMRFRRVITGYIYIARMIDQMNDLKVVRTTDAMNPWDDEAVGSGEACRPPANYTMVKKGEYWRNEEEE